MWSAISPLNPPLPALHNERAIQELSLIDWYWFAYIEVSDLALLQQIKFNVSRALLWIRFGKWQGAHWPEHRGARISSSVGYLEVTKGFLFLLHLKCSQLPNKCPSTNPRQSCLTSHTSLATLILNFWILNIVCFLWLGFLYRKSTKHLGISRIVLF